jgi:hypothetical protein
MKLLSAVIYFLALGSYAAPTEDPGSLALEARMPPKAKPVPAPVFKQTDDYKVFKARNPNIANGQTYLFTMKSAIDPKEKDPKSKALIAQLGFSHIYLISVQVVETKLETKIGRYKGLITTTSKVVAWSYDLVGTGKVTPRKLLFSRTVAAGKTIEFVKVTKKTDVQIQKEGTL